MQTCQVTQRASLRAEGGQRGGPRSTPPHPLYPKGNRHHLVASEQNLFPCRGRPVLSPS